MNKMKLIGAYKGFPREAIPKVVFEVDKKKIIPGQVEGRQKRGVALQNDHHVAVGLEMRKGHVCLIMRLLVFQYDWYVRFNCGVEQAAGLGAEW